MNHSNFTVFPALHFPTSYCSWTNSHPCAFQKPQAGDGATIAQRPQVGGTSDHMCRIILTLCCLALCSLVMNRCPALLPGAKSLPSHRSLIKIKLLCFKTCVHCWKSWSLVCNDRLSAAAAAAVTSVVFDSVRPHRWQPPGSPVPGILQARTLEWVAISFCNA